MNESEYYYNKASQDVMYADRQHEVKMAILYEQVEYNLVAMLKPRITKDGNQWCVLYGDNLQDGIAGFGDTPHAAILDFNKAFKEN